MTPAIAHGARAMPSWHRKSAPYLALAEAEGAVEAGAQPKGSQPSPMLSAQLLGLLALTQDGSGPAPVQTVKAAEDALARYQALMAQVKAILP